MLIFEKLRNRQGKTDESIVFFYYVQPAALKRGDKICLKCRLSGCINITGLIKKVFSGEKEMMRLTKLYVNWSIIITVSIILFVLLGCEKEKQNASATPAEQTKATVKDEEKNAVEVKATETKQQDKQSEAKMVTEQKQPEQKTPPPQNQQQAPKEVAPQTRPAITVKQLLDEISFWQTIAKEWTGMAVPDVNLTDINGKKHRLSDYKGKNVLLFQWTSWSPPCRTQIPFLIELRQKVGEDKLAILAVAIKTDRDNLEMVKDYVQKKKIDFPVFYESQDMLPVPFNQNIFVPCHYFIRPDGTLKLGVMEIITPHDLLRVLEAK